MGGYFLMQPGWMARHPSQLGFGKPKGALNEIQYLHMIHNTNVYQMRAPFVDLFQMFLSECCADLSSLNLAHTISYITLYYTLQVVLNAQIYRAIFFSN